jgi:1-deoxy-D-xylulose-5-phosphate reductoisomerase
MKKRIAVLGATGSIGKSTLDVLSRDKENFEVVLLSAHSNRQQLEELSMLWPDADCILSGDAGGKEKLLLAIENAKAQITINGISGASGLMPSIAAIESGSNLALANKESIVMAGTLVLNLAKEKNVSIIPVDSEHSAIFHLIKAHSEKSKKNGDIINEIILTASGGPFRKLSLKKMKDVSPEAALAHPTWNMGYKISIDSATMANKGLEVIEAAVLFNMPAEKIKVVIHPQSIIHSMVRLCNGVIYAQLSKPDMRHPIHDALYWPDTVHSGIDTLNFDSLFLEFEKPDSKKFPMLNLGREAARLGGLYPCAYNAANEIAVSAFMKREIGFLDISMITENVLEKNWSENNMTINAVLQADGEARKMASLLVSSVTKLNKSCKKVA